MVLAEDDDADFAGCSDVKLDRVTLDMGLCMRTASADTLHSNESTVGLLPSADDGRRVGSAEISQEQRGDPTEPKLVHQTEADVSQGATYLPEGLDAATAIGQCWAFGKHDGEALSDASSHNEQILKVIDTLGKHGSGRRAIVRAIAEKQGIVDEDQLQLLYSGSPGIKLKVPNALRQTLENAGFGDVLAPVNIITSADPAEILVNTAVWEDIEFEVALDSGSVVHVCAPADIPGYHVGESIGSRRGQEFLMGDGGTIPNMGESRLNLSENGKDLQSVFQIAAVTRPLMSVGRICDQGHRIEFDASSAVVKSTDGAELCKFERQSGGLYVARLKLRSPAGFGRRE